MPSTVRSLPLLAIVCAVYLAGYAAAGESERRIEVGDPVPTFHLTDTRYLPRGFDELPGEVARVLVFTTLECPIARRYGPRLVELERDLRDVGVGLAIVNVGVDDDMLALSTWQVASGVGFPVLKDYDGSATRAVGATRTPEAVVIDAEGRLRYRGRIDAQYRFSGPTPNRGREDLKEAILDVLAGREVRIKATPADGCVITPPIRPEAMAVDYATDVLPIVQRHCVGCHSEGGDAPFSLQTFEDARKHAWMIDEVIAQRRMPPWFGSASYGSFANQLGLSTREREILRGWVAAGSPPGDLSPGSAASAAVTPTPSLPSASLPALDVEVDDGRWKIGAPDRIVSQLGTTSLPAEGYVPYQYIVLPYVFLHDTWVSDVEIRSDNELVLHHANLAFIRVGERYRPDNFITGKVPGGDPMHLDPGSALLIPAGSVLGLQVHFVTTGAPEEARLSVGLRHPRETIVKRLHHKQITNTRFAIPPYAPDHEVRGRWAAKEDITALGMFAHMHLRGRDMTFVAHLPDGATETLLMVPNYSFDWQQSYRYGGDGRRFPAGTQIEVIAHYDNSTFNPYNPDPSATVRFGLQTIHEMMYGFLFYFHDGERLDLTVDPATGRALPSGDAR